VIQLMAVPASLLAHVETGAAYVSGALVKDSASHQILAHLQPTSRLSQWVFDVGMAGPLAPLEVASSLGANAQLLEIRGMLETLQTVASVGAVASVLNLGVSIGGFAMVLTSLRRMEGTMDKLFATVKSIENVQTADYLGTTMAAIERAESAFALPAPGDRRRYWEEADLELSRAVGMALKRLATRGVVLEGGSQKPDADPETARRLCTPEAVELLRWLLALSSTRVEVLLGLQMPTEAARQSRQTARWMTSLPFNSMDLAKAQLGSRTVPPTQMARLTSQASALSLLIERAGAVSGERAMLCDHLHEQGADSLEYVLAVRNHPEATVLMLPHSSSASRANQPLFPEAGLS